MYMQLKPHEERDVTAQQVIERLRPQVAAVRGAKFFMQAGQDINVGGRLSKTQFQYTLTDTNSEELNHWAPILEETMRKLPQLEDVTSDQEIAAPHLSVEIDRIAASRLGLDCRRSTTRFTTRSASARSRRCTPRPTSTRSCWRSQPQYLHDASALSKIYVPGPNGAQVPLSAFAHQVSKLEPLSVNHQGQFPAVTLSFNLPPGVALGPAVEAIQARGRAAAAADRPRARSRARRRRSRRR